MSPAAIADFLFAGPASSLWPIAVLPFLSALIGNRAARTLPPTRADWRVAAALAAAPGLVMLILLATTVGKSLLHLHPGDAAHFVEHHLIWAVAPLILVPALAKARRRRAELRALTRLAAAPGPRLRAAAVAVGLERCLELPLRDCECFLLGLRKPIVFVSSGAVARLSDEELRATLLHEKAHAQGGDSALLAILSFLGDLVPTNGLALIAFREARERRADCQAVKQSGPVALAGALLAFARPAPFPAVGIASDGGAWRLRAILGADAESVPAPLPPRMVGSLAANALFTSWPAVQIPLAFLLCPT